MNTLSWLVYSADVIPNIGNIFIALAVVVVIILGCIFIHGIFERGMARGTESERWAKGASLQKKALFSLWVPFIFITLSAFVPSERTIYMIAASEIGETAYDSFKGSEIYEALKKRIEQELKIPLPEGNTPKEQT